MRILERVLGKFTTLIIKGITFFFRKKGYVLMIHWVTDQILAKDYEQYRITTNQFEYMLRFLKGKNIVRLENWENESDFWALTIDDVPETFYINAYPLLKKYSVPFTLFVNVSLLGREGYISVEQLQEMSRCELCTVGSHGDKHSEYVLFNREEACQDLNMSKKNLERLLDKPVELFAFPYGSYYACGYKNKYIAGQVYKYAFGTISCPITYPLVFKKYFLPRINVDQIFLKSIR